MNYSVGSLADLISGSNTPNKPKVVKKAFKKENGTENAAEVKNSTKGEVSPKKENENVSKTFKKKKTKYETGTFIPLSANTPSENGETKKQNRGKKRKLEKNNTKNDGDSSPPKKQKIISNKESAAKRIKKKMMKAAAFQDPEETERTIFVGNVPLTSKKNTIKSLFKKYGEIECIRVRGIPVANLKTPKKVAAIKKEFNPKRNNVFCYIRYLEKESATKAEAENGSLFEGHHLRVHGCSSNEKPDETKAIFVGNLSFNAVEDDLWKLFESCGPISHVRIIRDSFTGMGKGFAYVNFKDSDAVQLALEMENVKLNNRELRISLSNLHSARKNKESNKNKKIRQPGKQKLKKGFKKESSEQKEDKPQVDGVENKNNSKINEDNETDKLKNNNKMKQNNAGFQGTQFNKKNKKKKVNKGLLQKKKLVKKIAPKPQ